MDGNLLFEMLSAPARQAIFRSMAPLAVGAGELLIRQGDADATLFYVLERGTCDVLVAAGAEPPKRVHTYAPGRCVPGFKDALPQIPHMNVSVAVGAEPPKRVHTHAPGR